VNLSTMNNPQVAAMLLTVGTVYPSLAPLMENAAARLCGEAERKKADRSRPDTVRTASGHGADAERTEGGGGVVLSASEMPLVSQNQGIDTKTETKPSPIQPPLRADLSGERPDTVRTLVQQDSRGWTRGFTRFYAAYPDGSKALTCARQWLSAGLEPDTDRILGGLELWKMSERWQTGHVLHMRNFLTERMWEQAPPAPKSTVTTNAASQAAPKFDRDAMLAAVDAENARRKAHGIKR